MHVLQPAVVKQFLWHMIFLEQKSAIVKTLFVNIKIGPDPQFITNRFIFSQSLKFLVNNQNSIHFITMTEKLNTGAKFRTLIKTDIKARAT